MSRDVSSLSAILRSHPEAIITISGHTSPLPYVRVDVQDGTQPLGTGVATTVSRALAQAAKDMPKTERRPRAVRLSRRPSSPVADFVAMEFDKPDETIEGS